MLNNNKYIQWTNKKSRKYIKVDLSTKKPLSINKAYIKYNLYCVISVLINNNKI